MRKSKFIIFLIAYALLISNFDFSLKKESLISLYNENEIKDLYLEDSKDVEYSDVDGYITMNYKGISTTVDETDSLSKKISIKDDIYKNNTRKSKLKKIKTDNNFDVDISMDEKGNIVSVDSTSQTIEFVENNYNLNNVLLNGQIVVENISSNGHREKRFANGGIISYYDNSNGYEIMIDGGKKIDVVQGETCTKITDDNGLTTIHYDDNGNEIFKQKDNVKYELDGNTKSLQIDDYNVTISKSSINGETIFYLNNREIYRKNVNGDAYINDNYVLKGYYDDRNYLSNRLYFGKEESFTYNSFGYIEKIVSENNQVEYKYDGLGRLIESMNHDNVNKFSYDLSGNIINSNNIEYLYSDNRLIKFDGYDVSYDGLGNIISFYDKNFMWAGGTLLDHYQDEKNEVDYDYDSNGIRTEKKVNGRIKKYYYANQQLALSNYNNINVIYLYDDDNNPFGFFYDNKVYYYGKSICGVIESIYDENLNEIVQYEYDDWGKVIEINDLSSNGLSRINDLLYKDYVYDFESEMYYLNTRYYNPSLKRFISIDSFDKIQNIGSKDYAFNLYSYCMNNPIMMSDPSGAELVLIFSSIAAVACMIIGVICAAITVYFVAKAVGEAINNSGLVDSWNSEWENLKNSFVDLFMEVKKGVQLAIGEYLITLWMWWVDNNKQEYHHIVAQSDSRAFERPYVIKYCGSINDVRNMVWLKYRVHKHLHTNAYHYAVNATLRSARMLSKVTGLSEKVLFLSCLASIKLSLISFNNSVIF